MDFTDGMSCGQASWLITVHTLIDVECINCPVQPQTLWNTCTLYCFNFWRVIVSLGLWGRETRDWEFEQKILHPRNKWEENGSDRRKGKREPLTKRAFVQLFAYSMYRYVHVYSRCSTSYITRCHTRRYAVVYCGGLAVLQNTWTCFQIPVIPKGNFHLMPNFSFLILFHC